MGTTEIVLFVMLIIGGILVFSTAFLISARKAWTLIAAGQILSAPYATFCLLMKNDIQWKILFAVIVLSGLIAVFNIVICTKEK